MLDKAAFSRTRLPSRSEGSPVNWISLSNLAVVVALAGVYFVGGKLGLQLAFVNRSATAVWPPTGIAFAALLVWGYRVWPGIWLGAFLVNLTTAGTVATSFGIAVGNTLEALLGAYLVNRFAGGCEVFSRPQNVFRFAVLAGGLSTAVAAAFGVTSLCLGGFAAWADYGSVWLTWWLGDAVGDLVMGPLVLLWILNPRLQWNRTQVFEAVLFLASLLLVGIAIFGGLAPPGVPLTFLCIPPVLWAAFRFGPREAVSASFVLAGLAVWGIQRSFGLFTAVSRNESLLWLQTYMGVIAVMALGVAATVLERKRATERTARLQAVTAALSGAPHAADIARIVVDQGITATGAQAGVVALSTGSDGLKLLGAMNYPPEVIEAWRQSSLSLSETPLGEAVRTGKPVLFESVETLIESYPHLAPVSRAIGSGARAAVPLRIHGRTVGGMWLAFPESRRFHEEDQALMIALAQQYAQALERARLYDAEQAARTAAEAASRLKDEFLATISHELRTPLTAIVGWARLLRSGSLDESTRDRAVEIIERNAKAQAKLIEDILDVSRVITGKLHLNRHPLQLRNVIEAAVDALRPAAEAKDIRLEKALDAEADLVIGDPDRLQQVVWNLVSNAVKFTPPGGRIEILLHPTPSHVEITVRDTGEGIKPEFLPHLFERFRQADPSLTRTHGGLGLGLAIVRHLVELHGGTVRADSPGPAQGATFTVRLPVAAIRPSPPLDETGHESAVAVTEPDLQALHGLRVLVVEDDFDTRALIAAMLQPYGIEVRTAASTCAALDALKEFQADLLISDIGMPGEDGYTFIQKCMVRRRVASEQRVTGWSAQMYTAFVGVKHSWPRWNALRSLPI